MVIFSSETYQKVFKKNYKRKLIKPYHVIICSLQKQSNQLNMIKIAHKFVGNNQGRLLTFGRL